MRAFRRASAVLALERLAFKVADPLHPLGREGGDRFPRRGGLKFSF